MHNPIPILPVAGEDGIQGAIVIQIQRINIQGRVFTDSKAMVLSQIPCDVILISVLIKINGSDY